MVYLSSSLSRYKRFKLRVMFRVLEWAGKTNPVTNYGLYWSTDILKHLPIDQVIKMPVDFQARFADDVCRSLVTEGKLTTTHFDPLPATSEYLNVTGIGNIAYVFMHTTSSELKDRAREYLEHLTSFISP